MRKNLLTNHLISSPNTIYIASRRVNNGSQINTVTSELQNSFGLGYQHICEEMSNKVKITPKILIATANWIRSLKLTVAAR